MMSIDDSWYLSIIIRHILKRNIWTIAKSLQRNRIIKMPIHVELFKGYDTFPI